jgi:glycosyltransferase involved in cell wall biosynthesis
MQIRRRQPSIGIVSNEFFDSELGRMGGFGWAARTSAECFAAWPELGFRPLLLPGRGELKRSNARRSNGVPLLRFEETRRYAWAHRAAGTSLLLTIDFRPNYLPVLERAPRVPLIVWVRDPRTPDDMQKIGTLRLPSSAAAPAGVPVFDCTVLAPFVRRMSSAGTPVAVAATAPGVAMAKVQATLGLDLAEIPLLPNPLDIAPEVTKSPRPTVAFVGRLDPIKRPWLVFELARRLPEVDFVLAGRLHFTGDGAWEPGRLPANVRVLGHVDGAGKTELLASAWMLVNTSIHEGLAISFLEALHCATPIVSCQDPESVTSRFGLYVGRWDGDGMDAIDDFEAAIRQLVDDHELRTRLGHEGCAWVRATHTREHFATSFARIAGELQAEDG